MFALILHTLVSLSRLEFPSPSRNCWILAVTSLLWNEERAGKGGEGRGAEIGDAAETTSFLTGSSYPWLVCVEAAVTGGSRNWCAALIVKVSAFSLLPRLCLQGLAASTLHFSLPQPFPLWHLAFLFCVLSLKSLFTRNHSPSLPGFLPIHPITCAFT